MKTFYYWQGVSISSRYHDAKESMYPDKNNHTNTTELSVVVCANCLSSLLCYPFHVWPSWHFTVLKFCPFLLDMFLRKHNCTAMFHIRQSYYIDWKRCWSKWCRVVEEVKWLMCFIRLIKVNLQNHHIVWLSDIHPF